MQSRGIAVALCIALLGALVVLGTESPKGVDDPTPEQTEGKTSGAADAGSNTQATGDAANGEPEHSIAPSAPPLAAREERLDEQPKVRDSLLDRQGEVSTAASEERVGEPPESSDLLPPDRLFEVSDLPPDEWAEVSTTAHEERPSEPPELIDPPSDPQFDVSTTAHEGRPGEPPEFIDPPSDPQFDVSTTAHEGRLDEQPELSAPPPDSQSEVSTTASEG
jgi:hypothetical protein